MLGPVGAQVSRHATVPANDREFLQDGWHLGVLVLVTV
jgi:hypothetical protein